MVRLCLLRIAGAGCAAVCFGCTGQNIEGTWLGPLPVEDAKACRIKIYSNQRFDVSCGKNVWVGAGKIDRADNGLTLKFDAWVHDGKVIDRCPTMAFTLTGEGNKLRLQTIPESSDELVWQRAKL